MCTSTSTSAKPEAERAVQTAVDYRHQDTGAAWLAERRFALLADEPGTGKSRTAVLAADLIGAKKIVVACPGVVRASWAREFARWSSAGRRITEIDGFLTAPPGDGVTIVSHAVLSDAPSQAKLRRGSGKSLDYLFAGAPYDVVIADEAAEFRKYDAARTRTLLGPDGLASRAAHAWCLSGEPIVNSAADLYPMVYGALRSPISWMDWCTHYCAEMKIDPYQGVKPRGIRNVAELADGLRPHVLRRTIESLGIPMPPLEVRRVDLAGVDDAAVAGMMARLDGWTPYRLKEMLDQGDEVRDAAISRVRHALGLAKAETCAAHVNAIVDSGDGPVIAFFQHTAVRRAMHEVIARTGKRCSWIDGTVSRAQLGAAEEWFQSGRLDALLVQTDAGGMGLTLHRSHREVVAELPWTATALAQALKRAHRIGQEHPCTAEILSAPNCWLDEVMGNVVSKKQLAAQQLLSLLTTNS